MQSNEIDNQSKTAYVDIYRAFCNHTFAERAIILRISIRPYVRHVAVSLSECT